MKLIGVTLTGADDATDPQALVDLSKEFPFVEWGILVSDRHINVPRYPSDRWHAKFWEVAREHKLKTALHVCDGWVRELVKGRNYVPDIWFDYAQRIQLNFHGQPHPAFLMDFMSGLSLWKEKQIIFQIDGKDGSSLFSKVYPQQDNVVPLFDMSHGGGVLPQSWPKPYPTTRPQGYAGGLGPDNIEDQLLRIHRDAAGTLPFWVDMETKLRNRMNEFDIPTCRDVLSTSMHYVSPIARTNKE